METLIKRRLASLPLQSLLEVSTAASEELRDHCFAKNILYRHTQLDQCKEMAERFDFALVHDIEAFSLEQVRPCIGLLKNLLSERVWLLVNQSYCPTEEWISLGFKRDLLPENNALGKDSYHYNLETYNYKRDWNNTRFWANPEHWNKRF